MLVINIPAKAAKNAVAYTDATILYFFGRIDTKDSAHGCTKALRNKSLSTHFVEF